MYVETCHTMSRKMSWKKVFEAYGEVNSVNIIKDRFSGKSKGFAFVEMAEDEAKAKIEAINGTKLGDREIKVNVAKPKNNKSVINSNYVNRG